MNGGLIREGGGDAALNEERQRGEGVRGGEEWLRRGEKAQRLRRGVVAWSIGRARRTCGVLRWSCGVGVKRLRDACAEEWLRGGAAA